MEFRDTLLHLSYFLFAVAFISIIYLWVKLVIAHQDPEYFNVDNYDKNKDAVNTCPNESLQQRWNPPLVKTPGDNIIDKSSPIPYGLHRMLPFESSLLVTGANILDFQHTSPPEGYGSLNPNLDEKIQPQPINHVFNIESKVITNGPDQADQQV